MLEGNRNSYLTSDLTSVGWPALATISRLLALAVFFSSITPLFAQLTLPSGEDTLLVDDAPEMKVIAIGKSVVIKKKAKEVFSWGGDVIIEGSVEGDVAVLGGTVIQREGAHIGGDVIIIGGTYRPESPQALREAGRETVVIGMFEEEFRALAADPTQIFAPRLTTSFIVQRILSLLFWFVLTLVFVTLAPGAVSRASSRLRLKTLTITGLGAAAFVLTIVSVAGSLRVLPDEFGAVVSLMGLVMLMLAYVFGRVVLQVTTGKMLQGFAVPRTKQSDSLAIFIGVFCWTVMLSLPYVWMAAVFMLFAAGVGLVLTVRSKPDWGSQ